MFKTEMKKVTLFFYLEEINELTEYRWEQKVDDESFEEFVEVVKPSRAGKIVNRIYRNRIEILYLDKEGKTYLEEIHSMV